jgi:hypothetical protein
VITIPKVKIELENSPITNSNTNQTHERVDEYISVMPNLERVETLRRFRERVKDELKNRNQGVMGTRTIIH